MRSDCDLSAKILFCSSFQLLSEVQARCISGSFRPQVFELDRRRTLKTPLPRAQCQYQPSDHYEMFNWLLIEAQAAQEGRLNQALESLVCQCHRCVEFDLRRWPMLIPAIRQCYIFLNLLP